MFLRKKNLEATIDEISNLAYSNLQKYSPSKQQLKTYLFKKLIKNKHKLFNKKFSVANTVYKLSKLEYNLRISKIDSSNKTV